MLCNYAAHLVLGQVLHKIFSLVSTLIQWKSGEEEENNRCQLWSRALQCRTVFYEILCLSSLLFPASSSACSTLLTLEVFRLHKSQAFIFLWFHHFSCNNILTRLIIRMESVEVLAATWHTEIDSQKDQISFPIVGRGMMMYHLLINLPGAQTDTRLGSSSTSFLSLLPNSSLSGSLHHLGYTFVHCCFILIWIHVFFRKQSKKGVSWMFLFICF